MRLLKHRTVGQQIGIGFGIILFILLLMILLSFSGVRNIVRDATQVIEGNRLDGTLAQKEVDHLNWANRLNSLFSDREISASDVETDHHLCAMGKWLYGDSRKQAEELVPSLKSLFLQIESPHEILHESARKIMDIYKPADDRLPGFLVEREADHLRWAGKIHRLFLQNLEKHGAETDPHKCRLGQWIYSEETRKALAVSPVLADLLKQLEEPHLLLHESAVEIEGNYRQIHPGLADMLHGFRDMDSHRLWVNLSSIHKHQVSGEPDAGVSACDMDKWFVSEDARKIMEEFPPMAKAWEELKEPHLHLHNSFALIREAMESNDLESIDKAEAEWFFVNMTMPSFHRITVILQDLLNAEEERIKGRENAIRIYETQTAPLLEKIGGLLGEMRTTAEKNLDARKTAFRIYSDETLPTLENVQKLLEEIRTQARKHILTDEKMLASARESKRNVSLAGALACILGIVLALLIRKIIVSQLQEITGKLEQGGQHMSSASAQLAGAAHSLSEGTSEQAASLEESAATLEEMSSAINSTAALTEGAQILMNENISKSARSLKALVELTRNMGEIEEKGGEISNIIKMIDDIAFQTGLLALNASVEAARAGESGSGFAVVANEVRNLAIRATEAAGNTQNLLEGMAQQISEGAEALKRMSRDFDGIVKSASVMGEKTTSITRASKENATGIEQINQAVQQMDTVTQQNATIAEESAASAEELSALAENTLEIVKELSLLTGKESAGRNRR